MCVPCNICKQCVIAKSSLHRAVWVLLYASGTLAVIKDQAGRLDQWAGPGPVGKYALQILEPFFFQIEPIKVHAYLFFLNIVVFVPE